MRGTERLRAIERTTDPLSTALPLLPQAETILIRLMRVSAFGLDDYFTKMFSHLELTEKHYHTLCVLISTKQGAAFPSELSEMIGTSRANMTKVLSSLESNGYIRRKNTTKDGRRSMILITTKGREVVNTITPMMAAPVTAAFSKLSADERTQLDALLRKLIVSFDEAMMSNSPIL